jgi:transcriptional regulator with XRE-family HTH domain
MLRCKRQRILLELAQHQVAALTKGVVSQPTLSNIEKGRINPNDKELAALASVLNCPANRLMNHVSDTVLGDGAESRDSQRENRR